MKEFIKNLKFIWSYTKGQRWRIIAVIFLNIIGVIFSIIFPIIYAKITLYITNEQISQLVLIVFILLTLSIIDDLKNFLAQTCSFISFRETFNRLQIDLGRHILELESEVIDNNGTGAFMQRINADANGLAVIFNSLNANIFGILSKIGIFVAIFIVNKLAFFLITIMVSIMFIIERKRAKVFSEYDKISRKKSEKLTGFVGELVRGTRDIKMLNCEKNFINELNKKAYEVNEAIFEKQANNEKYVFYRGSTVDIMHILLILLYVIQIKLGTLSISSATIIYIYSFRVTPIINMVGNLLDRYKNFNLSCSRVIPLTENKEFKKEKFGSTHKNKLTGEIEFKNVYFSYKREKVLKDINFKIKPNETVAFVGKSGAGKTTIFNLICKMYEPNKGTIKLDGINIKKLDKDSIRGNITIISQNPYIFNMSIKDNLRLVKENVTNQEIIEACRLSCLHDYIMSLPKKYDTIIGEGGVNLSGGERQRLAIARALIQKTEIILFDEATSALDNETQSKIQESIENLKEEYTILIVAHRLSTIINADKIFFIEDGQVKYEGTHKYLLKNSKEYKKLYCSELKK